MPKKKEQILPICFSIEKEVGNISHIPSVNALYRPSRGKKSAGGHLRFRKDIKIISFQERLLEELQKESFVIEKDKRIRINLGLKFFLAPGSFIKRDCDNMIKVVSDIYTQEFGINDRYTLDIYARKYRSEKEYEYLRIFTGVHYTEKCWDVPCSILRLFHMWQIGENNGQL